MSRSYKKHSYICDRCPYNKKRYNRKIRRSSKIPLDIPSGSKYRQLNQSWDICDYKFGYNSFNEFYKEERELFDSDEECRKHWFKYYKGK